MKQNIDFLSIMKKTIFLIFFIILSACTPEQQVIKLPKPLISKDKKEVSSPTIFNDETDGNINKQILSTTTKIYDTPKIPQVNSNYPISSKNKKIPVLNGNVSRISIENLPIPAFINEVFSNLLGLSFEIASELQTKKDLVTLKTAETLPPKELYQLAENVLENYGISIVINNKIIRFVSSQATVSSEPPLLISGRALPRVPITHRPIFQLIPIHSVTNTSVSQWIRMLFTGYDITMFDDPFRNAILLKGKPEIVTQVVKAIKLLDRPFMQGHHSLRIEPAFLSAKNLSSALISVLRTEGYIIGEKPNSNRLQPIIILSLEAIDNIIIFAQDEKLLEHARQWAITLDKPQRNTAEKNLFFYTVKNTSAERVATVINQLLTNTPPLPQKNKKDIKNIKSITTGLSNLVTDLASNSLIFSGFSQEWKRILPIIKKMDQPTRLVLIEVTVAEITLTDESGFGIEWLLRNAGIGSLTGSLGTYKGTGGSGKGLGISTKGLNYFPVSSSGETLAVLNAFASNNQVNILSTPRILVQSGKEATINIGTEIPIITSQGTSAELNTSSSAGILQQIQYRSTGLVLNVKPIIYSGQQVDLDISQEISEVQANTINSIGSPSIFNREVQTSLTLKDGSSVLLGGLISNNITNEKSSVPLLGDIPIVGRLFGVESTSNTRTELVIMIIPYIIENDQQLRETTEGFRQQLEFISSETK